MGQFSYKLFNNEINRDTKLSSKVKYNREYLISKDVAGELNTYMSFEPFATFNEVFAPEYETSGDYNIKDTKKPGAIGVRSIFNKAGAVLIGNKNDGVINAGEWRISNNVPLMDSPTNRQEIRKHSGCSVKELVRDSKDGLLGKSTYDYSDFMYCKHLGKVSNNYMITLRRFPLPVDDYISTIGTVSRTDEGIASNNSQSIGCMITWMGVSGNEMNNILKYNYKMPFTEQTADWEDVGVDADGNGGLLNSIAATFDKEYRKQYMEGLAGSAFNQYVGKFFKPGSQPYNASTFNQFQDKNKVYGPVDAVKKVYVRSKEGLDFDQDITLVFEYELKSYNGINGRQAMLDLISNILNVTYTTGTFWGGGYRGAGAHQNNVFANMEIFKNNNGLTGYVDALMKDVATIGRNIKNKLGDNPIETIKNFMNDIGGMILAGQLNKWGRPQKHMITSLLSPAPIGFWHLTIGNPHHPIMSMGNMILTDTTIEHMGPLGLDDFPTGLKVTCTLKRGKPRDLRDIEKMYMHGNDRIFYSMGPKVFDMYKNAKEYKGSKTSGSITPDMDIPTNPEKLQTSIPEDIRKVLKKYYGHDDTYSIYVAAAEQEYGAHKKPSEKGGTSAGDSRAIGTGGWSGIN